LLNAPNSNMPYCKSMMFKIGFIKNSLKKGIQ
jgi:hypothetical protein